MKLGPLTIWEWAQTDAAWWESLALAVSMWRDGQRQGREAAAAMEQHRRALGLQA